MQTSSVPPSLPSQNVIEKYAGMVELASKNANPDNWKWDHRSRAWELAEQNWQDLKTEWYGATARSMGGSAPPSLSLPFLWDSLPSILVRQSYVTTFNLIWARAMISNGRTGVIITGQPGTGKTLFQYYLLVRLLQLKQIVLFSPDGKNLFLFYHDQVYQSTALTLAQRVPLPKPKCRPSDIFIWSLFDIQEMTEPVSFLVKSPCLPVQTASSDPRQYKTWQKERFPLLTALPLWTREELAEGLPFQIDYTPLISALRIVYATNPQNHDGRLAGFPGALAVLKEREEDGVSPSPDDALDYLLEAAIDRFGYSARDVFGAVFNYQATTQRHQLAFNIQYSELQRAVSALASNQTADPTISHRILALSPVYPDLEPFGNVHWIVDFKSDWIAKCMVQKLGEAEEAAIRDQTSFLRRIPEARALAERFFEPLVHRSIAVASGGGIWPLFHMASNDLDPPQFGLARDDPPPVLGDVQFVKAKREIVKLQDLADLSLKDNTAYYVLEDQSFQLFDAFTVDLDYSKKSAILWVLKITTSRLPVHEASSMGYQKIRNIIARLKDRLGEGPPLKKTKMATTQTSSKPRVQVHYLLAVPQGNPLNPWRFPKGWNKNCSRDDHRGDVYCFEVPLAVH